MSVTESGADLHCNASYLPDTNRLLPQSVDSERGLLSSFLLSPKQMGGFCAEKGIMPERFHLPAHAEIFSVLMKLWQDDKPIDFIILTEAMREVGRLDYVGGPAFITELFTFLPTAANASYYEEITKEKHTLREIIRICTEYAARSYEDTADANALLSSLASELAQVTTQSAEKKPRTFKQALFEKIDRIGSGEPDADVICTGLHLLDKHSPLRAGDMPLVSGEKKSGKSICALTIATNVVRQGLPVLYFSLEDREAKVVDRIFAGVSRIPSMRHHTSLMSEGDVQRSMAAVHELANAPFLLRDDVFDLAGITAVARQAKTRHPALALIVVDYAQLVRGNRGKTDNREQEVANVSRTLRLLSMELNCALLLLCQLNSTGETRESRALEQDCTAMWKITKPKNEDEENSKRLIVVEYQRNGEANIAVPVAFLGSIARMENVAQEAAAA